MRMMDSMTLVRVVLLLVAVIGQANAQCIRPTDVSA